MGGKILRYIFFAVLAATAWSYYTLDSAKDVSMTGAASENQAGSGLEQKVLSFTMDGRSPKGVRQWHLEGNSAELIGEDIHLNDLKAVAYGEGVVINLSSNEGVYSKARGEVDLIGNVQVNSDNGFSLTTEKAKWSQLTKEISTDEIVHISGDGISASGKGGMANSDERTAVLREDVEVDLEPYTKVKCDGPLDIDYEKNTAVFYKNVKVRDRDGILFSDKMTVTIDPETKKIAQVTADGNVKIKRGKSYTLSEQAIYTESTKHAQLLGKPRIVIDPQELNEFEKFQNLMDNRDVKKDPALENGEYTTASEKAAGEYTTPREGTEDLSGGAMPGDEIPRDN
ncbi:MAG: LPS export ABC transporter periplasmic protein LptC [Candidatus Omnitrophota bacterium]